MRDGISVVLTGYRRSGHLAAQWESLQRQSVVPREILLWQNFWPGEEYAPAVSQQCVNAVCNRNLGVWARFAFALNARSKYIAVFDDDTFPGELWLENCLTTIRQQPGLLGTRGLIFNSQTDYGCYDVVGWPAPNSEPVVVDVVGHCWFFEKEFLSAFWREIPDVLPLNAGEDLHFSHMLQKHLRLPTVVPPHPSDDHRLWGSLPDTGYSLGDSGEANWRTAGPAMQSCFVDCLRRGWKLLRFS